MNNLSYFYFNTAQSVERRATGFDFRQGQNFSLLRSVQTGSEAHPASYPMGTGALSLGAKLPRRKADHSSPSIRSRTVELLLYFPIRLHGVVLN
jgi:hypothetical protein